MSEQIIKQITIDGVNFKIDAKTLEDNKKEAFIQTNISPNGSLFFDAKNKQIKNITAPTDPQDAVNLDYAEKHFLNKGNDIDLDGAIIKNLGDPADKTSAISQEFLEKNSLKMKTVGDQKTADEDLKMNNHLITGLSTNLDDYTCAVNVSAMTEYVAKDGYVFLDSGTEANKGNLKVLAHRSGNAGSIFSSTVELPFCFFVQDAEENSEQMYLNPPMENGIWYKTLEMDNGNPIYVAKFVYTNDDIAGVSNTESGSLLTYAQFQYLGYNIIDFSGYIKMENVKRALPIIVHKNKTDMTAQFAADLYVGNTTNPESFLNLAYQKALFNQKDFSLEVTLKAIKIEA